ncbi:MAG: hypothetical protein FJ030_01465 [Chloroflexi bacterium]|nr:hypothetical protein [Chloroflexota bacterium]
MTTSAAGLYRALSESLAPEGPPAWLARAGREWPLFEAALRLAPESEAAQRAATAMAEIGAEPHAERGARYRALFSGPGRPPVWLYESAFRNGRLLGPETFAVEKFYRAAGMETASAELPDHASLELAFLGWLAGQEAVDTESEFLKKHAGRWLPELGRTLARSGDEVYAPIGQLLADWLEESLAPALPRMKRGEVCLPAISQADLCTLCGFCAQVCPTRALAVRETATETALILDSARCVACGQCERICETHALKMNRAGDEGQDSSSSRREVLRRSPRAMCRACGEPMVSRAELDFVAERIGHPAWLEYCVECRPAFLEKQS